MREAMIVTCLRCKGWYDMDFEEGWDDHHTAPDGSPCEPAKCVTDEHGHCASFHNEDWRIDTIVVDDYDRDRLVATVAALDLAAVDDEPASAASREGSPDARGA